MRTQYFAALLLLVAGCSGRTSDDDDAAGGQELEKKRIAAEASDSGDSGGSDPCEVNAWYGDGECDSFCAEADADCTPSDPGEDPIVCATFLETSDGVCSRPDDDPCRSQDPDCTGDDDEPVACTLIAEESDGVCGRPDEDPCRFQDPDCVDTSPPDGGYDCDLSNVACEIATPTCGDGEVPTANGLCYGPCVPKDQCAEPDGVVCAAYIEESDGVCSRPENDPCKSQDPDCVDGGGNDPGVGCAEYIEEPDGVCSRPPEDPCKSQDPDCTE
jgi:hypothetical protein